MRTPRKQALAIIVTWLICWAIIFTANVATGVHEADAAAWLALVLSIAAFTRGRDA